MITNLIVKMNIRELFKVEEEWIVLKIKKEIVLDLQEFG
jgi:hypothetical protein